MSDTFLFLKGHGTENDFVLLPDPDGTVHGPLAPGLVAALCDRRAGIGGDGVMRAVRCEAYDDPAAVAARGEAAWFMDYRNSDGSFAEMCGNGVRVFARYLADHEGVPTSAPLKIGTRAGIKVLTFSEDGQVTVDMGSPEILAETKVGVGERRWPATQISMGNPHAVVFVDSLDEAGPLHDEPSYDRGVFPHGVNVEFVVRRGERHVAMRVHERGSGETRSCGTGACAVMVAAAIAENPMTQHRKGDSTPKSSRLNGETRYRVDVPGGVLQVTWREDGHVLLTGPAVIVAEGQVSNSFAAGA
ncbi:MAG TPA: diaminopimelate epimerase [Nocardioidaceae bacterium]|nr:diaminopimelate epimerase [Nocardioidaceae bacterium]